jgi:hypothetical protein
MYHCGMLRSRRLWLVAMLGPAAVRVLPANQKGDVRNKGFAVDINVGSDRPDSVLAILQEVHARNIEPIKQSGLSGTETVVAAVVLAKAFAKLIVRLLSTWTCGVIVDARAPRILTQRNCDVPSGTVIVINADGTKRNLTQPSAEKIQSLAEKFGQTK